MAKVINGQSIPNLPWEEKPEGCRDVIWRSKNNPIITRDAISNSNSIFNSAIVAVDGEFKGVFRSDDTTRRQGLHVGRSKNGVDWEIEDDKISFICEDEEIGKFNFGYDPRVCKIDDKYYVTWCNGYHWKPTIGIAYTTDFEKFYQLENAFLPFNRNGVLFPKRINGNYAMISRPSDNGHTPFGDIYYSESPDLTFWGKHRLVMEATEGWQGAKIGGGPTPIETDEGWLTIYHGVLISCNGFTYSAGVALLDKNEPWKVLYRTKPYIMAPREIYELAGDVPNVVFPCTALCDADTGRIAIYYGAADTVIGLAYTTVDALMDFMKKNSI